MDTHEATGALREAAGAAERQYGEWKNKVSQSIDTINSPEGLQEAASRGWEAMMDAVQNHPGVSFGVSLLAGAVLGALIALLTRE